MLANNDGKLISYQTWGSDIVYLDTLYLDTVFNLTDMLSRYICQYFKYNGNLSRYITKVSEFQIHFRNMIILNTHICNCIF